MWDVLREGKARFAQGFIAEKKRTVPQRAWGKNWRSIKKVSWGEGPPGPRANEREKKKESQPPLEPKKGVSFRASLPLKTTAPKKPSDEKKRWGAKKKKKTPGKGVKEKHGG